MRVERRSRLQGTSLRRRRVGILYSINTRGTEISAYYNGVTVDVLDIAVMNTFSNIMYDLSCTRCVLNVTHSKSRRKIFL